jgi:hypothetical protein
MLAGPVRRPVRVIDAAVRRLPELLTGVAFAGTALLLLTAAAVGGGPACPGPGVLGGIALASLYLVLALISPSDEHGRRQVRSRPGNHAGLAGLDLPPGWRLRRIPVRRGLRHRFAETGTCHQGAAKIPFRPFMITGAFFVVLAWHS